MQRESRKQLKNKENTTSYVQKDKDSKKNGMESLEMKLEATHRERKMCEFASRLADLIILN